MRAVVVLALAVLPGTGIDVIGHSVPSDLSGYSVTLMQPWDVATKAQATAQGSVPFAYKDLTSTRSNDCGTNPAGGASCIVGGVICPPGTNDAPYYAGGLGFCWTWRNHPAWFYRNNGNLVTWNNYPYAYLMDWQRTGYQRAWADKVKATGWDWIWADNALTNPRSYTSFDTYGGAAQTQAATKAMLGVVGRRLHRAGVRINANLGWTNLYPSLWNAWLPLVDGLTNEHSVGDVAGNKAACAGKVCFFGGANFDTFEVIT